MADPALVFENPANAAGTHVLLIGMGDYPWLVGGSDYVAADHAEAAMGMGQLFAPPVSMRRLADWFLDPHGFANPARPLASLALVLSEAQPASYAHPSLAAPAGPLPRGTIDEVENAVGAWIKRASARRDNAVVIAFCGHGVQSGNPVLLCRDYGANDQNPFRGSIDFEQFRIALSTRQPDTQLVLVDACRTPDADAAAAALLGQDTPGNRLIKFESLSLRDNAPAAQSVHFATSLYSKAWGRSDGPSLFSEALIAALAGGGADMTAGWWVTTSRLHAALATYLARVSRAEGVVQRPVAQTQDFPISKPGPITVPLYVTSRDPAIWGEPVKLRAWRGAAYEQTFDHAPADPPVEVRECALKLVNPSQGFGDVIYDVEAAFGANSQFADCVEKIIAYPPEVTCELPVSKRP